MRTAELVTFGGGGLDRAAHVRGDAAAIETLKALPTTRMLPLWRGKPFVRDGVDGSAHLVTVAPGHAILDHAAMPEVFLGRLDGVPYFAVDVGRWEPDGQETAPAGTFLDATEQRFPGFADTHRFAELRALMVRLSAAEAELAATAKAVLGWHATHLFCARCGHASNMVEAGWQRHCPACGARHFPRTDPVVIMLITYGNDVLVGRSPGWPERMYSLLAGFVEPGETIEAAVRREVLEEADVRVGPVGYLASQPWPFPASLMIGCYGRAESRAITVDPVELDDAIWVSRERMLAVMAGEDTTITAARRGAIARFLIDAWLADRLD